MHRECLVAIKPNNLLILPASGGAVGTIQTRMNTQLAAGAPVFAGFWRRVGAFVVDVLVLGLVGISAGFFLFDQFASMGAWGRLLGFGVALAYFGVMNSSVANGQTPGKRVFKIRAVGADGAALPMKKSMLRFCVLGVPWFLNDAAFSADVLTSPAIYPLSVAVFGLCLAIIYLFIFNRPTRQSLHDLAGGSYVITADSAGSIARAPLWRTHLIVVAVLLVATAVLPYFMIRLAAREPFATLMRTYRAVSAVPGVSSASVNRGWSSTSAGKTNYLQVTATLSEPRTADAELAKRLAKAALDADPSAMKLDLVQVDLVYGYYIGIASSHQTQTFNETPADWIRDEGKQ